MGGVSQRRVELGCRSGVGGLRDVGQQHEGGALCGVQQDPVRKIGVGDEVEVGEALAV